MITLSFGGKSYQVEKDQFLSNFNDWDENFARGMASMVGITGGLSEDHWKIIRFIRDYYKETGKCPLVYETRRMNQMNLQDLKKLFPTGYLRGACKLAGITYKESYPGQCWVKEVGEEGTSEDQEKKTYEVNVQGFLINPHDWDKKFALNKAYEMKMPKLTDQHWRVINFLRESFVKKGLVPTVYETCEITGIDVEELEKLFPDGYHRGAVKIAGLRVR
jgi:TusE/DsrC/DsvC family sulfur relay protein